MGNTNNEHKGGAMKGLQQMIPAKKERRGAGRPERVETINGQTKTVNEWCHQYSVSKNTVQRRMKQYGISFEDALTRPPYLGLGDKAKQGGHKWNIPFTEKQQTGEA